MQRSAQRGFSLVEMMVSIALSLIVLSVVVTMFAAQSAARRNLDRSAGQIENGRYALDMLADELRLAGYYAELVHAVVSWSTPDPCQLDPAQNGWAVSPLSTVPAAITGFDGSSALPCLPNRAPGTAALAVRRLSVTPQAATTVNGTDTYVQFSNCQDDPVGTRFSVGTEAAAFQLRNGGCTAPNVVRRYISRVYFIAACDVCGVDTIPTLKVAEALEGALVVTPLAQGIQDLQLDYGFDLDGDGTPDAWRLQPDGIAGSPGNDWSNVMAVRINALSRSVTAAAGFTDTRTYEMGLAGVQGPFRDDFIRRAYSMAVRLNNPAGRREI